mmetsp:Transcript_77179/g.136711  ORF Transcript_77179/g.136711 Transcript_77179/m.136711 type:complete len:165 (-) Transcript_77179:64-558(-)
MPLLKRASSQKLLKRTMTTVNIEINKKPLGIVLNLTDAAVIGGIGYFLSHTDTSGCGYLPSIIKFFGGYYLYSSSVSLFACAFGYKFGLQYFSFGMGCVAPLTWLGSIICSLSWLRSGGCKKDVLYVGCGVLGYYLIADVCLKSSLISEEDQHLMLERLGFTDQ